WFRLGSFVSCTGGAVHFLECFVNRFQGLKLKLEINSFLIGDCMYISVDVNKIMIIKTTQNVQYGISFTNVAQKLISQTFTFTCTFYKSRNIYNFNTCWQTTFGLYKFLQFQ